MKPEGDSETNCSWHASNSPQRLRKETSGIGNQSKNRDHSDPIALLESAKTLGPGDFRRPGFTHLGETS